VNGPFDDIPVDRSVTTQVDWEVELGVVIGTPGKNIRRADALAHVFGYTVINDISARDVQIAHGGQWFKGKSLDGSCPMGPMVVTADEFGDPQAKRPAVPRQRRQQAGRDDGRHDLSGRHDHRVAVQGDDARGGRRHRHRHAVGRRHGAHAAGIPAAGRPGRDRDRGDRHAANRIGG
jgi:hypothetical protein